MLFVAIALVAAETETDVCDSVAQLDMNKCAVLRSERADAAMAIELDAVRAWGRYNGFTGKGVPGGATSDTARFSTVLELSQKAFLAYREAQCRLELYPDHGGSIAVMVSFNCRANLTEARIAALQAFRQ